MVRDKMKAMLNLDGLKGEAKGAKRKMKIEQRARDMWRGEQSRRQVVDRTN
jgi:hypothetical protein